MNKIHTRYRLSNNVSLYTSVSRERTADHSFLGDVQVIAEDVAIVGLTPGVTDGHVLWSDGRRSPAWDLPDEVRAAARTLPRAASSLLCAVWGSDGGSFADVGGALVVARVTECTATVVLADPRRTRGGYQSPEVKQLNVELDDGSRVTWYAASVGYSEGYLYELCSTLDAARAALSGYDAELKEVRRG
jgi:hypothetical protein